MKKVLFIDRDGTLVIEPPVDYQLDSLEKLEFYPEVFTYLRKIVDELDYEIVMVTNQDGLGTESFPEEMFWPAHNKMILAFENEGIQFADVHIDRTFPEQNAPTRKPGTAMLTRYINGNYDLSRSFVIGDRESDIQLAKNLSAKGILMKSQLEDQNLADTLGLQSTSWQSIYPYLLELERTTKVVRNTNETKINVELNLDGTGKSQCNTGLPFFDHMLDQLAKHGGLDLNVQVNGDLEVDEHHTMEDTALALGNAFKQALGKKTGINRYGFLLPMDDCLAQVAIDFGGRPWMVWDVEFKNERIGDVPTEMFQHFFKSFSDEARCNLNIKCEGENDHHKIESIYKAWSKAIKMAINRDTSNMQLPTTKGQL